MEEESNTLLELHSRLAELNSRTVYLTHLNKECHLKAILKCFKAAVNARFSPRKSGSRRCAFVEFASAEAATKSVKASKGRENSDGGSWSLPTSRIISDFILTKLHVSCLPRATESEDLLSLFPKAEVIDLKADGPKRCLGSATVKFSDKTDALEAFRLNHGKVIHGSPIVITFEIKKKVKKQEKVANGNAIEVKEKSVTNASVSDTPANKKQKATLSTPVHSKTTKDSKILPPKLKAETGTPELKSSLSTPTVVSKKTEKADHDVTPSTPKIDLKPNLKRTIYESEEVITPKSKKRKRRSSSAKGVTTPKPIVT